MYQIHLNNATFFCGLYCDEHESITRNKQSTRGQHATVCINPLMVDNAAPEPTMVSTQCKKISRPRRAMGFTIQLYTGCSPPPPPPVKQLARDGLYWAHGVVFHSYIFMVRVMNSVIML